MYINSVSNDNVFKTLDFLTINSLFCLIRLLFLDLILKYMKLYLKHDLII